MHKQVKMGRTMKQKGVSEVDGGLKKDYAYFKTNILW